ncbi:hypothetical protein ACF0H5_004366 [Mactra antiquata]
MIILYTIIVKTLVKTKRVRRGSICHRPIDMKHSRLRASSGYGESLKLNAANEVKPDIRNDTPDADTPESGESSVAIANTNYKDDNDDSGGSSTDAETVNESKTVDVEIIENNVKVRSRCYFRNPNTFWANGKVQI